MLFGAGAVVSSILLSPLVWQLLTLVQSPDGRKSSDVSDPLAGKPAPSSTLPAQRSKARCADCAGELQRQGHCPQFLVHPQLLCTKVADEPNFWASWCDPCKQEAPLLEVEWQKVQSRNIIILGVDFQDSQANGLSILHQYHSTYPCVQNAMGSMAVTYNLVGLPTTYFISGKGIVVNSIPHQMTAQELQQQVLLAQT